MFRACLAFVFTITSISLLLVGCQDELNPAELAKVEARSDALCACMSVPHDQAGACIDNAERAHPYVKPKGDLSQEDRDRVFAAFDRGSKCAREIRE